MTGKTSTAVGTPPASLSAQLLIHVCEYMKPGVWYAWGDVVKAVTPRVPRHAAGRRGYAEWTRGRRRITGEDPPKRPFTETDVRGGARTLIRWSVDNVIDAFEWRGPRQHREIRLLRVPPHIREYIKVDVNDEGHDTEGAVGNSRPSES
jgi:hypothetical protein